MTLPHQYPFRFVEPRADGRTVVRLSAGAFWTPGQSVLPLSLIIEAAAQAAAATFLEPEREPGSPPMRLYLAGVEQCVLERHPMAGETLEIVMRISARYGPAVRVEGEIVSEGGRIGTLALLLARGPS